MANERECSLCEVVQNLAQTHERAAASYRDMAAAPGSVIARSLLGCLVLREERLAEETAALTERIDPAIRVRRPDLVMELPRLETAQLTAETVIEQATALEEAVEKMLHTVATPPVAAPKLIAELFALHRRELFGLGVTASRLRDELK